MPNKSVVFIGCLFAAVYGWADVSPYTSRLKWVNNGAMPATGEGIANKHCEVKFQAVIKDESGDAVTSQPTGAVTYNSSGMNGTSSIAFSAAGVGEGVVKSTSLAESKGDIYCAIGSTQVIFNAVDNPSFEEPSGISNSTYTTLTITGAEKGIWNRLVLLSDETKISWLTDQVGTETAKACGLYVSETDATAENHNISAAWFNKVKADQLLMDNTYYLKAKLKLQNVTGKTGAPDSGVYLRAYVYDTSNSLIQSYSTGPIVGTKDWFEVTLSTIIYPTMSLSPNAIEVSLEMITSSGTCLIDNVVLGSAVDARFVQDTVAPAPVVISTVTGMTSDNGGLTINWYGGGDDNGYWVNEGTFTIYYSTVAFSAISAGLNTVTVPSNVSSATLNTYTIMHLSSGTVYYVNIDEHDASGNRSALGTLKSGKASKNAFPITILTLITNTNATQSSNPTFAGTSYAGVTIRVYIDGALAGKTTTDYAGQWKWTSSESLTEGTHTIQIIAEDTYGNESEMLERTFRVGSTYTTDQLEQPYPNPARINEGGVITIMAGTASSGDIKITVFDVDGRQVRIIYDGVADQGLNTFTWNGRDDNGDLVGSGNYMVLFNKGNNKKTKWITVLR